ncbi:MAG: hypothetical protein KY455_01600 [Euryarchaeota archaeon]|nr:hypothetical protein [Euryarchaeota archaeon]
MRGSLAILLSALLVSVAIGDLASRYVGPVVPYLPAATGQESEGGLLNDAGTGGDAGDSRSSASLLMGFGLYEAGHIGMDIDWYRHPPALDDVACVRLAASGASINDRILEAGPWSLSSMDTPTVMGVAVASLGDSYVAFNDARPHQGVAEKYSFETRKVATTMVGGDGGSGGDAGSKPSEAVPLMDGCTTGALTNGPDNVDLYSFRARSGDRLVFTLGVDDSASAWFALIGPDGGEVSVAEAGESIAHHVEEDGKWYLAVANTDNRRSTTETVTATTAAGAELDGDSGSLPYVIGACRPLCLLTVS